MGTVRPGGRTARTRRAVHAAVRELLAHGDEKAVTVSAVAQLSGVHQATVYRRWRTPEALLLDVASTDLAATSPVPATGDLAADLLAYTTTLVADLSEPGYLGLFRSLVAAGSVGGVESVEFFAGPRLNQFAAMLDASGASELTALDIVELVVSPVYVWALIAAIPAAPVTEDNPQVRRLVANVLAVQDGRRRSADAAAAHGSR